MYDRRDCQKSQSPQSCGHEGKFPHQKSLIRSVFMSKDFACLPKPGTVPQAETDLF